jgi:hypothetical protein
MTTTTRAFSGSRPAPRFASGHADAAKGRKSAVAFIISATIALPYTVAVYLGDLKLTPIKILIVSLLVPACVKLITASSQRQRRLLASDAFALGVFLIMFLGPVIISGARDFVSAFSQALEFYGMYLIARAYLFELSSIENLIRGLQIATVVVVFFAVLDILTQRYIAQELANALFPLPASSRPLDTSESGLHRVVLGMSSLRAASTFDHPILLGTFCVSVIPLYLFIPMSETRRWFLVGTCVLGCLTALSSAPLLALCMTFGVYAYDRFMRSYQWRWKVLISTIALGVTAFSLASDNPLSWLFRNLTLDPQTAYFRLMIWDAGLTVISQNPWLGIGFNPSGNRILDASTDSLLLARAINFGIPLISLLYLSALAAMVPARAERAVRKSDPLLDVLCKSFSVTLSTILFISMTVTFWNATWLFFAMCIGVRVCLKEHCLLAQRRPQTRSIGSGRSALVPR